MNTLTQAIPIQSPKTSLGNIRSEKELREATEGFESLFIQKLLGVMQEGLGKNDMLSSQEEGIWRSMLDEEYAKSFSKVGGIGLANMLYQQLAPQVLGEPTVQKSTSIDKKPRNDLVLPQRGEHSARELQSGEQYPARELQNREQYPARELQSGEQYPARELQSGEQHSARELQSGEQHSARELQSGEQHSARELQNREQHSARELQSGEQYPARELQNREQHSARELQSGEQHLIGGFQRGERPLTKKHTSLRSTAIEIYKAQSMDNRGEASILEGKSL